jgi:hypothetical protein
VINYRGEVSSEKIFWGAYLGCDLLCCRGGGSPMTEPQLDSLDRKAILVIHAHRQEFNSGPLWRQVRERLGLAPPAVTFKDFMKWWENNCHGDFAADSPFSQLVRLADPQPGERRQAKLWRQRAFMQWRWQESRDDPLSVRLHRLRTLRYVSFDHRERSLDVGRKVKQRLSAGMKTKRPGAAMSRSRA